MPRIVALVLVFIAVAALILWAAGGGPTLDSDRALSLTANILILVVVLTSLVLGWRQSLSDAVRYTLIWVGLCLALVVGYAYRNEATAVWQRVSGELNPSMPVDRGGGQVVLRRAEDGHFHADVGVNGRTIRMLVDTGASTIALSADDAARAGIDVESLSFTSFVSTANGVTAAADVRLSEVRVGPIVRRNVRAMVTRNLDGSLLGLSFLDQLSKYSSEADQLVLQD
jgi:aspartyl protease family protein